MRPFQRGFFCADLSLRYPYRDSTITVPMLLVYMLVLPILFIAVVETLRSRPNFRPRRYALQLARPLALFSAGFIATYLSTELAKHVVGRLRPHFYAACQPHLSDGSVACDQANSADVYVEQYRCANRELTALQLRDLHASFPSAHSSLAFYAMLFLGFYLHAVWHGSGGGGGATRVLRHLLQFALLLVAWYIALSRVRDYWHHWSDVLAGMAMGVAYACLTAIYVGDMLTTSAALEPQNAPRQQQQRQQQEQQQQQQQPLKEHLVAGDYEWKLQTVLQT